VKIYLAARYSRYPEGSSFRPPADGPRSHESVDCGNYPPRRFRPQRSTNDGAACRLAGEALQDVLSADSIIAFTEEPRSDGRGGRHVEFGVAVAMGKRLIVVGPRENAFHCLSEVAVYPTWKACRGALHYDELASEIGLADGAGGAS
jgi:nucleoside 2-deoxyribosyltransferase